MQRKIILQLFNWKIKDIIPELENIKNAKFTHIQVSPLQGLKEEFQGINWFILYQPTNYKIGNDIGSKEDLEELCFKANKIGLQIIVDVVFHHIANDRGNDISDKNDKYILELDNLWYKESFWNIQNYNDRYETTHYSLSGLPALNLNNKELRKMQFNYLIALLACGVSGFRFDAIRHMSDENGYFEEMREIVGNALDNSYGECIDCERSEIDLYKKYMNVGTNISVNKDEDRLTLWSFSHDDENTFGKKLDDNIINREFEYLYNNYKADLLYYARVYNDSWKRLKLNT